MLVWMPAGRGTRTSRRRRRRRLPSPQQSQIKPKRILRARGALSTSMWTTRAAYSRLVSSLCATSDRGWRSCLTRNERVEARSPVCMHFSRRWNFRERFDFGYPHLAPPTLNFSLTCRSLMLAQSTYHKYLSGEVRGHRRGQRPGGEFEPRGRGRA